MTGASTGIGRAAVHAMFDGRVGPRPGRLLLGARDAAALEGALRTDAEAADVSLEVFPLDLASLASIAAFGVAVGRRLGVVRVDALVANAGIQTTDRLERSRDGHELSFAVNALANAALVWALAPVLASRARVIVTASGTHDPNDRGARRFGFRGGRYTSARALAAGEVEPGTSPTQAGRDRYATSKLCALLLVREFARRAPTDGIVPMAFDPGLVPGTGLARGYPPLLKWAWHHVMPTVARLMPGASTPQRSGATLAWVATSPECTPERGAYLQFDRTAAPVWARIDDRTWADDCWQWCAAQCADVVPNAPRANAR
jgi:NAD(P)-dependent dehydrogenase (short-subunit alcohol dehydrogenase family)